MGMLCAHYSGVSLISDYPIAVRMFIPAIYYQTLTCHHSVVTLLAGF